MLEEALEHLVRGIVDHPDDVHVDMVNNRQGPRLEVRVHPDDLGRVIGRSGRTAKALRTLVSAGRAAIVTGRPVIIFPEGTRVRVGEMPELKSGFAALYRALGLPVIPVAVNSGRLWGRGLVHRSGTVTFKVGETIPAGLKRAAIEARVHAAINALEPGGK